eukprot:6507275-Prymnesium_polylepis.1
MGSSTWAGLSGYCLIVIVIAVVEVRRRRSTYRRENVPRGPRLGPCGRLALGRPPCINKTNRPRLHLKLHNSRSTAPKVGKSVLSPRDALNISRVLVRSH